MIQEKIFCLVLFLSVVLCSDIDTSNSTASPGISDTYLTPVQIIIKNGYPAEAHVVQSKDGYFLELHRIPHGKSGTGDNKRTPVFLHHGLLGSSVDWVINGPDKSLAYRLADEGYDVWLANARGNTFSKGHVKYAPTQREFWNFSFDEMAYYDLPAAIDHILKITGEKQLVYVGHSLGTTIFFAMASSLPEYNKKIKFQISFAPVGLIPHATSSLRLLVPHAQDIQDMSDWYSHGSFLEHNSKTTTFIKTFCAMKTSTIDSPTCEENIIFSLFGKDPAQFNASLLPIISSNMPAGTSGKNMMHCAQLMSSSKFSHFDYGRTENFKRYHTAFPPEYNLSKISIPVRLYYSDNDILAPPLDAKILYQKFRKPLGLVRVNWDQFNHVDFLWANDLNRLLNDEVVEFIKNATDHYSGFDFVQNTIVQAVDIRNSTPSPVNVPFDEAAFLTTMASDMFGFLSIPLPKNVTTYVANLKEAVDLDRPLLDVNQVKKEIEGFVNTTQSAVQKVVSESMEQIRIKGNEFASDVQNTANKVGQTVTQQITNFQKSVEEISNKLENRIINAIDKFGKMFPDS